MKKTIQIVSRPWNDEKVYNSCEVHDIKTVNMDKLINEFTFLDGDIINVKGKIYSYNVITLKDDKRIHVEFFNIKGIEKVSPSKYKHYTVSREYIEVVDVMTKKVTKYVRHWNPKTYVGSYVRFTRSDKIEII